MEKRLVCIVFLLVLLPQRSICMRKRHRGFPGAGLRDIVWRYGGWRPILPGSPFYFGPPLKYQPTPSGSAHRPSPPQRPLEYKPPPGHRHVQSAHSSGSSIQYETVKPPYRPRPLPPQGKPSSLSTINVAPPLYIQLDAQALQGYEGHFQLDDLKGPLKLEGLAYEGLNVPQKHRPRRPPKIRLHPPPISDVPPYGQLPRPFRKEPHKVSPHPPPSPNIPPGKNIFKYYPPPIERSPTLKPRPKPLYKEKPKRPTEVFNLDAILPQKEVLYPSPAQEHVTEDKGTPLAIHIPQSQDGQKIDYLSVALNNNANKGEGIEAAAIEVVNAEGVKDDLLGAIAAVTKGQEGGGPVSYGPPQTHSFRYEQHEPSSAYGSTQQNSILSPQPALENVKKLKGIKLANHPIEVYEGLAPADVASQNAPATNENHHSHTSSQASEQQTQHKPVIDGAEQILELLNLQGKNAQIIHLPSDLLDESRFRPHGILATTELEHESDYQSASAAPSQQQTPDPPHSSVTYDEQREAASKQQDQSYGGPQQQYSRQEQYEPPPRQEHFHPPPPLPQEQYQSPPRQEQYHPPPQEQNQPPPPRQEQYHPPRQEEYQPPPRQEQYNPPPPPQEPHYQPPTPQGRQEPLNQVQQHHDPPQTQSHYEPPPQNQEHFVKPPVQHEEPKYAAPHPQTEDYVEYSEPHPPPEEGVTRDKDEGAQPPNVHYEFHVTQHLPPSRPIDPEILKYNHQEHPEQGGSDENPQPGPQFGYDQEIKVIDPPPPSDAVHYEQAGVEGEDVSQFDVHQGLRVEAIPVDSIQNLPTIDINALQGLAKDKGTAYNDDEPRPVYNPESDYAEKTPVEDIESHQQTDENQDEPQLYHAYYAPADHQPPEGYIRLSLDEFNRLFKGADIQYVGDESQESLTYAPNVVNASDDKKKTKDQEDERRDPKVYFRQPPVPKDEPEVKEVDRAENETTRVEETDADGEKTVPVLAIDIQPATVNNEQNLSDNKEPQEQRQDEAKKRLPPPPVEQDDVEYEYEEEPYDEEEEESHRSKDDEDGDTDKRTSEKNEPIAEERSKDDQRQTEGGGEKRTAEEVTSQSPIANEQDDEDFKVKPTTEATLRFGLRLKPPSQVG